ncbi:MAG: thiamine-phosphate kinase [Gammaproteobacteria bacterium]|nr:thiamine-phosphate kinase [Gammaproteobacteria bacterium]
MNEFDLIRTFFASQGNVRDDVAVSIGDDAAVVSVPCGMQQVLTTDILVVGTHFLAEADPIGIGHKSLAVNLSDLAAMGAVPKWFTLNLSLPEVNASWLQGFCRGLFGLANQWNISLIGGDTVRGPLTIGIQAGGVVPTGKAMLRSGAKVGDRIYVTGTLGDAGVALLHQRGTLPLAAADLATVKSRLDSPIPRLSEGLALRDFASSCIDISDGLLSDLRHIASASTVGARIMVERLPVSTVYRRYFEQLGRWDTAITAGDDYELCFTIPERRKTDFEQLGAKWQCGATYIGDIETEPGVRVVDRLGVDHKPKTDGYEHFAAD